ncbi:MarR family winged helix-turn-helix transcriptional regulator [Nonomuraea typhae]|uniref:MarR family winged helix-turn-helix transcriptional regulator n=1 Tax=Nonomuraea typhae TaxID=2603600 RepID=UPI0012FBCD79|nr:MarR family transcriptional regulator [Nonomuraea typhae]
MFDLPADVKESAWLIEEASLLWTEVTLDAVAEMDDLSLTALRHLLAADRHGPLKLSALACQLGLSASATGRMVDRLVTLDLLKRSPATHSRREVRIEVTCRGHEILEQLRSVRRQRIGEALNKLPAADRHTLTRLLQQLTAAAEPPCE